MKSYLDLEDVSIERIAEDLYDFSQLGGISYPDVLLPGARQEIIEASRENLEYFITMDREVGPVKQEMKTLYFERFENGALPEKLLHVQARIMNDYAPFYEDLARKAGFENNTINSVGIHYYPQGSLGITPHQDFASDRDLVTILVVEGGAPFGVCEDREKNGARYLHSGAGAAIFMRAARIPEENPYRPFHFVEGPTTQDRYTILLRRRDESRPPDDYH